MPQMQTLLHLRMSQNNPANMRVLFQVKKVVHAMTGQYNVSMNPFMQKASKRRDRLSEEITYLGITN